MALCGLGLGSCFRLSCTCRSLGKKRGVIGVLGVLAAASPILGAAADIAAFFKVDRSLTNRAVTINRQALFSAVANEIQDKSSALTIIFPECNLASEGEIHKGIKLNIPTLIMHSHQSKYPKKWGIDAQQSDVILDVKDMTHNAKKMKGDVQTLAVKNGLHDLVLSAPPVREKVYQDLFSWLEQKMP